MLFIEEDGAELVFFVALISDVYDLVDMNSGKDENLIPTFTIRLILSVIGETGVTGLGSLVDDVIVLPADFIVRCRCLALNLCSPPHSLHIFESQYS